MIAFVVLAAYCVVMSPAALAQSERGSVPITVKGSSNEDSKAALALLAQTINEDEFVILIARLGSRESVRRLNYRRVQAVRSYIDVTRPVPFPDQKIVAAEGQPVSRQGRVEVYLRGKLFMIFVFDRNKNFAPEG